MTRRRIVRRSACLVTLGLAAALVLAPPRDRPLAAQPLPRQPQAKAETTDASAGRVMTVTGPIAPDALGVTLPHEHLFLDLRPPADTDEGWRAIGADKPTRADDVAFYNAPLTLDRVGAAFMGRLNRDNRRFDDEALAIAEAEDYRRAGGRTMVDVTTNGIHRHPAALVRVANATGLNIVMGTGWHEHGFVGTAIDRRSIDSLADEMVREITVGVAGTGIRAGIIGEIGVRDTGQAYEQKLLAAAAHASLRSGAAISIHMPYGSREQAAVLNILQDAGADLTRVAIGHANPIAQDTAQDRALLTAVLDRGAYLQFDMLGDAPHVMTEVSDHDVAVAIVDLLARGYGKQLLLSQDVCEKTDLKAYGGNGYAFVPEQFVPYLRRLGVTGDQIRQLLVENPARLLTLAAPRTAAPRSSSR